MPFLAGPFRGHICTGKVTSAAAAKLQPTGLSANQLITSVILPQYNGPGGFPHQSPQSAAHAFKDEPMNKHEILEILAQIHDREQREAKLVEELKKLAAADIMKQ